MLSHNLLTILKILKKILLIFIYVLLNKIDDDFSDSFILSLCDDLKFSFQFFINKAC